MSGNMSIWSISINAKLINVFVGHTVDLDIFCFRCISSSHAPLMLHLFASLKVEAFPRVLN